MIKKIRIKEGPLTGQYTITLTKDLLKFLHSIIAFSELPKTEQEKAMKKELFNNTYLDWP
jgi:hypothetical protein